MGHWEYSKTYDFSAKAYIPFQYTCGKCGKLVTGRAEIKEELMTKDTSRNPSDLKFNRIDTNSMQAQAVSKLRQQLMMRRGEVKCGDFSLLEPYKKCPHCGAIQKWGTISSPRYCLRCSGWVDWPSSCRASGSSSQRKIGPGWQPR